MRQLCCIWLVGYLVPWCVYMRVSLLMYPKGFICMICYSFRYIGFLCQWRCYVAVCLLFLTVFFLEYRFYVKAISGIVLLAVHQVVKYLPTAFDRLGNRRLEVYSGMRIRPFTFCYDFKVSIWRLQDVRHSTRK
jgi:hypothetical protein